MKSVKGSDSLRQRVSAWAMTQSQMNAPGRGTDSSTDKDNEDSYNDSVNADKCEDMLDIIPERTLCIDSHVGFDGLPDQITSRKAKEGFTFNILCVGATGLGKSTLMNSLFNTQFQTKPSSHELNSVKLVSEFYEVEEKGVRLNVMTWNVITKLNIIETAGYGDQLNKEGTFSSIEEYLNTQFEAYLREEMKFKRSLHNYPDTRVHVCLYFVCPTRAGLKPIDIACLKMVDSKVNIIPIIAKADAIPHGALSAYKDKINADLTSNGIYTYHFPKDDESVAAINGSMNSMQPFAVVGSNEFVRIGGKVLRGRQYPWGVVQVENERHCDFVKLREMLLRTNMEDLREQTHYKHYERYRRERLEEIGFSDTGLFNKSLTPEQVYENRKQMFQQEMERKETELMQILEQRCKQMDDECQLVEEKFEKKLMEKEKEFRENVKYLEEESKSLDKAITDFIRLTTAHTKKFSKTTSSSSLFGTLGRCNRK